MVLGLIGVTDERQGPDHGDHAAHKWMMIGCCVPMLVIALALVASGTAGPGVVTLAIGWTLMVALMMMSGTGDSGQGGGDRN